MDVSFSSRSQTLISCLSLLSSASSSSSFPLQSSVIRKEFTGCGSQRRTPAFQSRRRYRKSGFQFQTPRCLFQDSLCENSVLAAAAAVATFAAALQAMYLNYSRWRRESLQVMKFFYKFGLVPEIEEKLASAAVAAAAAASVAKVAVEAAKVASEAALQAKMMADEALSSAKTGHSGQNSETGLDVGKDLARFTPFSILKSKEKVNVSSSTISAAREAARRRVEVASAASKRAENLDAIFKVAELAAEAVS